MGKVFIRGKMAENMKDNGQMENNMEQEYTMVLIQCREKVDGKMDQGQNGWKTEK